MISGVVSWVVLYVLYAILFPPFVSIQNTIVGTFGVQYPALQAMATNLTSLANAAFVLIAIGVFIFMLVAGYLSEPLSSEVGVM